MGVMATMDGFPFLVAAEKGIYDSLGLKVNFTVYLTETDRDASFEAHQIDGMVTDYTSAAVLQSKGVPLRSIMQNDGYLCLLTGRYSKLNSIAKLKNANFCASRNSFAQYAADCVLLKAKIPTNSVNQPEISQIPLRLMMLQEEQVDATFLPDPYATIAMNSGCHTLITTQEMGIYQMTTAFSTKALKEKEASVKALIKGYNLAVDYLLSHPSSDWADVLTSQLKVPANVIGLIILPPYQHARIPSLTEVAQAVKWLKTKNAVKESYNGTELVDTSYVEKDVKPVPQKKRRLLLHHGRRSNK
jgi:NitT/TauT family transport system substrate-binding protein